MEKTSRIVIRGGILLTMSPGDPPHRGDIYIQDDRIMSIGDGQPPFSAHEADMVIEAEGCVVMPGLINSHTHTPMTIMRSTADDLGPPHPNRPPTLPPDQDWRNNLTPEDHYWSSYLAIAEMIRSGTTAFIDMYFNMDRVAQAVTESGIRAGLGWEIHTFRVDPKEWLPYDEPTARRTFEASARFASDWHDKGDGRVKIFIAPHETATCHEPWLSRSAQLAKEMGLGITIHVAESEWEVEFCRNRYGMTPVQAAQKAGIFEGHVIGAHSQYLTEEDIAILAQADYSAAACLGAYLKSGGKITPVVKLLEAGVNVALGTDSAQTNNNLNLWEEIHLNATLHGFLEGDPSLIPNDLALRLATVGGARALGMQDELGTLEPGKKADIVIVDLQYPHLNPLEGALIGNLIYAANGNEVRDVIIDGRVVMREREILTFDEGQIIREANRRLRQLRRDVDLPFRYSRP